jgi:hypothetical protein
MLTILFIFDENNLVQYTVMIIFEVNFHLKEFDNPIYAFIKFKNYI